MNALTPLQKKLWRELWRLRGQVLAIALVIVGGSAVSVMSLSAYSSLMDTRDSFYREFQFGDLFVNLSRAPNSLLDRLESIPGVATLESRVSANLSLEIEGFDEPITGHVLSLPQFSEPRLNQVFLLQGRMPQSYRDNEVLVSDAFAEAHALQPGDRITAIIKGHRENLQVVGVGLSPEYVYQIAPGGTFPDYLRYGVLWMPYEPLATAYDMDGAFNSLSLRLQHGANPGQVIQQLDYQLKSYGGRGAFTREDQQSNKFLSEEFAQLRSMALMFPLIFLSVATFLLSVVIGRIVTNEREIIAVLKAFGYANREIAWHYLCMTLVITMIGLIGGFLLGNYLGQLMTGTYAQYYRFPDLVYNPNYPAVFLVMIIFMTTTALGTAKAVYFAASLPPAEAMRPEPQGRYKRTLLERMGLEKLFSQPDRMILRHLERKPLKSLLSVVGLSLASAIMMVGNFQQDAIDLMLHVQFKLAQKEDLAITFNEPVTTKALHDLDNLPGVEYLEGSRASPIILHYQQKSYRTSIQGFAPNQQLRHVLDEDLNRVPMPEQGLLVSEYLADRLGFAQGDQVYIEFLEGEQRTLEIQVAALAREYLGLGTYMRQKELNALLGEGPVINMAFMNIDSQNATDIYRRLREIPAVAAVNLRQTVIDSFNESLDRVLIVFTLINAALGAVIAFGVVYNTMRITFSERARELASLRVLGFRRTEVAYILLGELGLLTLASLPIGFALGFMLCQLMVEGLQTDLYRVPLVLTPYTFGFSALIVLLSAIVSAVIIWIRVCHLDLVRVLKTRE